VDAGGAVVAGSDVAVVVLGGLTGCVVGAVDAIDAVVGGVWS
jgi:hypothetical protein